MKSNWKWFSVVVLLAASASLPAAESPAPQRMVGDLTPLHDPARVLVNPHKGWSHHYPDNPPNKYRIAKDEDLLAFPGMDHLYIRLAWAYLEPREVLNKCGYWLFPKSLELPDTAEAGATVPMTLTLENRGVAPPYAPYELRVKLSSGETNWVHVAGRAGTSWLPEQPIVVRFELPLPAALHPGRYPLAIGLFDAAAAKERPVEFALQESARDAAGYYRVGTVSVSPRTMDAEPGWTRLFNGSNLEGWTVKCRPADRDKTGYWKVVDGAITAETPPGSKHHYIWLLTDKEYDDFTLRLKVQTDGASTGNSGIQVRSRYDDVAGWLDGPQVDINPPGPWRNGFIYDETRGVQVWLWPDVGPPANAKPEHAPAGSTWRHAGDQDAWNDVQITCRKTRITTVINGVTIADYDGAGRLDDATHRARNVGMKGHIGLQIHPGDALRIRFKDLEVRQP